MTPQAASFLLPLVAPVLYAGALFCIPRLTGWHRLSRRHPLPPSPGPSRGRLWRGSLRLGRLGHYNSSVVLSAHEQGLRIAAWFHLRIGHPPIFLPWDELSYAERSRLWILEGLDIKTRSGDRLWIPMPQARQLRKLSQGRFWPTTASKAPEPAPGPVPGTQATLRKD